MNRFLFLLCLLFSTTQWSKGQDLLESANIAYNAQNFKQAVHLYQKAKVSYPQNQDLHLKLAHAHRFLNDFNSALENYNQAEKISALEPIIYYYMGTASKALGQMDAAKLYFNKFASMDAEIATSAINSCDYALMLQQKDADFDIDRCAFSASGFDDYAPVLLQDELIFTSSRQTKHDALPGGLSNPNNQNFLYRIKFNQNSDIDSPSAILGDKDILPTSNLAPFSITPDQKMAISSYNQFSNGVRHIHSASLNRISMEIHTNMTSVDDFVPGAEFPVYSSNAMSFPFIYKENNEIYFAAYGLEGGFGGYDLWKIAISDDGYGKPQNLGREINTEGDEICPFIDASGRLFFSSDFHYGLGGFDIFTAINQNDNWVDVRSLGAKVNSSFDDCYFIYDAENNKAYFSSNRSNNYDLYAASLITSFDALLPAQEMDNMLAARGINKNEVINKSVEQISEVIDEAIMEEAELIVESAPTDETVKSITNEETLVSQVEKKLNTTEYQTEKETKQDTTTEPSSTTSNNVSEAEPCAMNFYIGAVLEQGSDLPIEGVSVYVRNNKSTKEQKIEKPSNQYGEYALILDPLTSYSIVLSKAGYANKKIEVHTGNGGKKTLLGTQRMELASTYSRNDLKPFDKSELTAVEQPSEAELINPIRSSSKFFSFESNGMKIPENGYQIQLLVAASIDQELQLKMGQFGNLFVEKRENNVNAYRVGTYVDKDHLNEIMDKVKLEFPDAFKVMVKLEETNNKSGLGQNSKLVFPLLKKSSENSSIATNFESNKPIEQVNLESNYQFGIQLGVFQADYEKDFSSLKDLGKVTSIQKANGLTYFYLQSFETIDQARAAKLKIQEKGIVDPFVVAFKNGVQVPLSEALNQGQD